MPIYHFKDIPAELVTPKHSTAFGPLITGEQIEVGMLSYRKGEGAKTHAHPHEQVIVVLKGHLRFTLDGETSDVVPGMAIHIPPNIPHSVTMIEDSEVLSAKGIVDGVGHKI
jgi:quercetin dioxygenase-like cupin family protein